ncbi:hypothetical protein K8S17_04140 [bacterium]|nr:hypothetical protein [bacterium]
MSPIAKLLGVAIPVFVSSAFCLSIPFILIAADTAVLVVTVFVYFARKRTTAAARTLATEMDVADLA